MTFVVSGFFALAAKDLCLDWCHNSAVKVFTTYTPISAWCRHAILVCSCLPQVLRFHFFSLLFPFSVQWPALLVVYSVDS